MEGVIQVLQVLFSDECRMALGDFRRRAWTRGARKQRTVAGFPKTVQFWGAIGLQSSTGLLRRDRMNSAVYQDVLQRHLLPVFRAHRGLTFQQVSFPAPSGRTYPNSRIT